jgi:hypothetical protein
MENWKIDEMGRREGEMKSRGGRGGNLLGSCDRRRALWEMLISTDKKQQLRYPHAHVPRGKMRRGLPQPKNCGSALTNS